VGTDKPDEHFPSGILDHNNQAIRISFDIENKAVIAKNTDAAIGGFDFGW
jgi:hypothetical protein